MDIILENMTDIELKENYTEIIKNCISLAIDEVQCPYECEVSITIVDNQEIQKTNKEFRNINKPTDVLSFPMIEYDEAGDFTGIDETDDYFNPDTGELVLGDIIISFDKAISQAEEYGHSVERELGFLVVHSMLHLFGFDHINQEDSELMFKKQIDILEKAGLKR